VYSFTDTLSIEYIAPVLALNKKAPLTSECVKVKVKVPLLVIVYNAAPLSTITLASPIPL